jgi:hypothetical protein
VTWCVLDGDCRDALADLPAESVQTCVTSPPYFGLRDYGHDDQIGLEATPDEFVAALVGVFRDVRRVLRDDGTLWVNIGDSYSGSGPSGASYQSETTRRRAEGGGTDGSFRVSKTLAPSMFAPMWSDGERAGDDSAYLKSYEAIYRSQPVVRASSTSCHADRDAAVRRVPQAPRRQPRGRHRRRAGQPDPQAAAAVGDGASADAHRAVAPRSRQRAGREAPRPGP